MVTLLRRRMVERIRVGRGMIILWRKPTAEGSVYPTNAMLHMATSSYTFQLSTAYLALVRALALSSVLSSG